MQRAVEEYLRKKKEEFLIQEGLVVASLNPHMKDTAIQVADEEYAAIREAYFLAKPKEKEHTAVEPNKVSIALKVIACITYIAGIIWGIVSSTDKSYLGNGLYYTDFSFETALIYWSIAILAGTLILGFSEIITLLHEINHK